MGLPRFVALLALPAVLAYTAPPFARVASPARPLSSRAAAALPPVPALDPQRRAPPRMVLQLPESVKLDAIGRARALLAVVAATYGTNYAAVKQLDEWIGDTPLAILLRDEFGGKRAADL